MKYNYPT